MNSDSIIHRKTNDGKWIQGCDHTSILLNHKKRNEIINNAIKDIKEAKLSFDTIACSGVSGMLVAPRISEILNKNIMIIRKENERRYSPFQYEGVVPSRYIIVDDLICSGKTIRHILKTIREDCVRSECIGVYCFLKDKCSYGSESGADFCKRDLGVKYL